MMGTSYFKFSGKNMEGYTCMHGQLSSECPGILCYAVGIGMMEWFYTLSPVEQNRLRKHSDKVSNRSKPV